MDEEKTLVQILPPNKLARVGACKLEPREYRRKNRHRILSWDRE